ncbi:MAG: DUF4168 domain-containing protein [Longimicrobiales bacterium]
MRRLSCRGPALIVLALLSLGLSKSLEAQDPAIGKEQLTTYAKAIAAMAVVRDRIQAEMAAPGNKKDEAQQLLQDKMRQEIAKVLQEHGLTEPQYRRITYVISTDPEQRKILDEIMGIKPPAPPPAAAGPAAATAASTPVGTHLGHITSGFSGTPNGQGLLPTAMAEARIVAEHAALAAKSSSNLEVMKTHAGHVIHAIDPGQADRGPGNGYGLKKAAAGVAAHIELAARSEGASQNATTHSVHVATAARNTVQRADQILALAQQIQATTTASEAAALVTRLNALAEQLMAGHDANGDGRIGWQEGEGGLQHVEQHVNLLMQGEMPR